VGAPGSPASTAAKLTPSLATVRCTAPEITAAGIYTFVAGMSPDQRQVRSSARAGVRKRQVRRRRLVALGALVLVGAVAVVIATASGGGSAAHTTAAANQTPVSHHRPAQAPASKHGAAHGLPRTTVTGKPSGVPGTAHIPILMYHVIAPPPAGAPFPGLYVPEPEFAAQMQALKAAGWHAVTLDQVEAYWKHGVPLGPGKPVVISFDNGYRSQYVNALPVLQKLGWVGNENIQLTGLPPSQGGLTHAQVRGLIAAGWELDTQGISHADLISLDASELEYQVATARKILQKRYGVPVNWFCYPSGHYNATVINEVKAAGFVGSTTVIPGWAGPSSDPFTLPRLRVLGGTSPQSLLAQISDSEDAAAPPASYGGAGIA
jgi:peptidoglycan/xylan/chitin deacetylase (PgdA/CDA1 family)